MFAGKIRRRNSRGRAPQGFTLVELLLVMVIIAIMAGVVVWNTTGTSQRAKKAAAIDQITNLRTALKVFEGQNGRFPTSEEGLQALTINPNPGVLTEWSKLMDKIPPDPWGNAYVYKTRMGDDNVETYDLYSKGPSGTDQNGTGDNIKP